jgi:hypothetical protein
MKIALSHQAKVDSLREKILELQELAEELEEEFPRGDIDDEKIVNSLCRKLTDRLSSAHDVSIKLAINLERIKNDEAD